MLDAKGCHELHVMLERMIVVCCCPASIIAFDPARCAAERVPDACRAAVRVCRSLHLQAAGWHTHTGS